MCELALLTPASDQKAEVELARANFRFTLQGRHPAVRPDQRLLNLRNNAEGTIGRLAFEQARLAHRYAQLSVDLSISSKTHRRDRTMTKMMRRDCQDGANHNQQGKRARSEFYLRQSRRCKMGNVNAGS